MKSNLKRNLLLGFSASLLILILSSVASIYSIINLLKSSELVNHTNKLIIELNNVAQALTNAETGQRGFLLVGEEDFLAPYENARQETLDAESQIARLTSDNPLQQERIKDLHNLIIERFRYLDQSISDKRQGTRIAFTNLRKGGEIMDRVRELVNEMIKNENDLLVQRTDAVNRFSAFTPTLVIAATLVALLITVLFYVRVRNELEERANLQGELEAKEADIRKRIEIIKTIAERVSAGDYTTRVDDQQSDALGNVAGSLNKMADSLKYSFTLLSGKEWLQTGLSQLNDLMIGEKELEILCSDVIGFTTPYVKGNVGAIYILDGNDLNLTGGYAYSAPDSRRRIKVGEGILGQAIRTKRPVRVEGISDENIQISYATGEARPGHVVVIPVFDGPLPKGAMEVASLTAFTEQEIEFLTDSSANIGIAISTAQNRRKLQELLEETQSQAEELKTQHSELENLNSELEAQAEKLQASEEELKVQQEELKQANTELEERSGMLEERNTLISERNLEIQVTLDKLAQSTKYKSEFLANMSHELRTPLNSILLLSRLMSENNEKNLTSDQIEYAQVIQSSGIGLLALIDEILDLSKIESGKMSLEYQATPVLDIIHDMTILFNPMAKEKKIEFRTKVDEHVLASIETDKLRLEQILRNLLSNAIKFTSTGFVSLEVKNNAEKGGFVLFVVTDTGIGISDDKQSLIFDAFQQADGSTRRKYGGTGLGLSISRELVKLLGGEVSLTSEPDKGSVFTVSVPATRVSVSVATAIPTEKAIIPMVAQPPAADKRFVSKHIPESIPDDRDSIGERDKVMLIIEDDPYFAKALLDYTRKRGYKGIVAVRGDEGIELARQLKPVGILLDIELPVKSGWEVMEDLKANPETRTIPVHIISSYKVRSESLVKGAVDFSNKPVTKEQMQEVFSKIEYVLTHHPKQVLIVEENTKHARALAYFLETFDIVLEIQRDIGSAIHSLKNENVDCVILDMGIPDHQSYVTLDEIKKTPGLENLPIIIFTGNSLSQVEELKIKRYADSIIVKTANSYKRILDEVSLFLHLMEKNREKESMPTYHKLGAMDEVLKKKTVLIADDDMRNIFSMTKALEKYQMNIIMAVDGKDAWQKLKVHPKIDIVLMDMMMPEMDGYETTRTIRRDARFRQLPIIAVTAKAMMGDRAKCINAGASDYITKPVDIDQLMSLLRVWLYETAVK